jgi:hypothetical protein
VRGSESGTVRPGWLTLPASVGTSTSWTSSTSDWVPAGTSSQPMCGLRLLDSRT